MVLPKMWPSGHLPTMTSVVTTSRSQCHPLNRILKSSTWRRMLSTGPSTRYPKGTLSTFTLRFHPTIQSSPPPIFQTFKTGEDLPLVSGMLHHPMYFIPPTLRCSSFIHTKTFARLGQTRGPPSWASISKISSNSSKAEPGRTPTQPKSTITALCTKP